MMSKVPVKVSAAVPVPPMVSEPMVLPAVASARPMLEILIDALV